MNQFPENYSSLRAAVLRYQARLEEEEHAASQCLKAWQAEYPDNGLTSAYLSGKAAGYSEALLILRQELEGREAKP